MIFIRKTKRGLLMNSGPFFVVSGEGRAHPLTKRMTFQKRIQNEKVNARHCLHSCQRPTKELPLGGA